MKDIKSILIGVFATTCLFLFMGQTMTTSQVARYQLVLENDNNDSSNPGYIFDTKNAEIVKYVFIIEGKENNDVIQVGYYNNIATFDHSK